MASALGPAELMRPMGPAEGQFAGEPIAGLVVHINRGGARHTLVNTAADPYLVEHLDVVFPLAGQVGEVCGVHVAWSGNTVHRVERVPAGPGQAGDGSERALPGATTIGGGGIAAAR